MVDKNSANAVFIHMAKINLRIILWHLVNLSVNMRFSLGSTGYQQITKFVKMALTCLLYSYYCLIVKSIQVAFACTKCISMPI